MPREHNRDRLLAALAPTPLGGLLALDAVGAGR